VKTYKKKKKEKANKRNGAWKNHFPISESQFSLHTSKLFLGTWIFKVEQGI
jgi:hypothetical protein